ncbi:hypothetical protein AMAG_09434 [Allomyces macrogynus ATCC 38327]|uniref:Uncharacterized protein n=1 Tax=Allomyces macrogynus (strain ATCC 38327) TaxID=578462 RepID=A0A0L0SPG2_ALLM3|nr:hypothetical protein AMAG_09434 [Allomyces macrogynus ATCC 38327]|eukprot:KNE64411.1 hypothetical protein AMAG_09434 [Allomyces macrogynus ATCC 38327]
MDSISSALLPCLPRGLPLATTPGPPVATAPPFAFSTAPSPFFISASAWPASISSSSSTPRDRRASSPSSSTRAQIDGLVAMPPTPPARRRTGSRGHVRTHARTHAISLPSSPVIPRRSRAPTGPPTLQAAPEDVIDDDAMLISSGSLQLVVPLPTSPAATVPTFPAAPFIHQRARSTPDDVVLTVRATAIPRSLRSALRRARPPDVLVVKKRVEFKSVAPVAAARLRMPPRVPRAVMLERLIRVERLHPALPVLPVLPEAGSSGAAAGGWPAVEGLAHELQARLRL